MNALALFVVFWSFIVGGVAVLFGGLDIFREPLVLLLIATLAPIVRDTIANTLRAIGKAGEDAAAKTPDPNDDAKAHARRLVLDGVADALKKGDTGKANELLSLLGLHMPPPPPPATSTPSGDPTPIPGADRG